MLYEFNSSWGITYKLVPIVSDKKTRLERHLEAKQILLTRLLRARFPKARLLMIEQQKNAVKCQDKAFKG